MKKRSIVVIHLLIMSVLLLALTTGCKKETEDLTVTDIDGNVYQTVTIGSQVWLKENLKTTRYRNGDPIPNVTDDAQWLSLSGGAYCNYDNISSNSATYGLLYNWDAVIDPRNICPAGWHIPSDTEWKTLIDNLGGEEVAGGKLKEKGTAHWISPNTDAIDQYGFKALPAGYRLGGTFQQPGYYATWWSRTEKNLADAWIITLINSKSKAYIEGAYKIDGHSVRCVRD
ncbi:MAG: fibrobacter succinogenes major paralogous domain-containing protein [Bacteroidales bacterium]|nr:fibrobacter succinogenes major paralogous domain-containing protein [Bacteroidales bacterium]